MATFEQKVREELAKVVNAGNAKGEFALYGNFKDDTKQFVEYGEAQPGVPYNKNTIIRYASQSKLLGSIITAKAIEDGLLNLTDRVSKYLIEFKKPLQYYLENGEVSLETYDGNELTVAHLLSMSAGFGYQFIWWGNLYNATLYGEGTTPDTYAKANKARAIKIEEQLVARGLFGDEQFDTRINKAYQTNPNFKLPSWKKYIAMLTEVPLLFRPGTNSNREVCYAMDYDILGAVVDRAVILGGAGTGVWDYFKRKFLVPMNAKSIFQLGNPDKPKCLKKRLAETAFKRPLNNLQLDGSQFAPDPSLAYLATNNQTTLRWTSEFPDDGFHYNEVLFTDVLLENAEYRGGFGASFAGTPYDYTKFLGLIFNKGMYKCERLISETSISLVVTPSLPEYISFGLWLLNRPPFPLLPVTNFNSTLITLPLPTIPPKAGTESLLAIGYMDNWCAGCATGNSAFVDALYNDFTQFTDTCLRWGSYYQTNYFLDWQTGNYVIAGTQIDANSFGGSPGTGDIATNIFKWLQNGELNKEGDDCHCKPSPCGTRQCY